MYYSVFFIITYYYYYVLVKNPFCKNTFGILTFNKLMGNIRWTQIHFKVETKFHTSSIKCFITIFQAHKKAQATQCDNHPRAWITLPLYLTCREPLPRAKKRVRAVFCVHAHAPQHGLLPFFCFRIMQPGLSPKAVEGTT